MSDDPPEPSERVYVVSSHLRGFVLLAVFSLAPWLSWGPWPLTGLRAIDTFGQLSVETLKDSVAPSSENGAVEALYPRRFLLAFASIGVGSLMLSFVPRRFSRGALAGATVVVAGVTSMFLPSTIFWLARGSGFVTEANYARWFLAAEGAGFLPFLVAGVSCLLLFRWNEWSVWWAGALAVFCFVCPVLGGNELLWGARACAPFAVFTFWREARRWDELARDDEA